MDTPLAVVVVAAGRLLLELLLLVLLLLNEDEDVDGVGDVVVVALVSIIDFGL